MKLTIDLTLASGADPMTAAEAIFDYLCASSDDDTPGVETFDFFDFFEVEQ